MCVLINMLQFIRKTGLYTISHVHVTDPRSSEAVERCRDLQLRAAEVIVDESEMRTFLEVRLHCNTDFATRNP